MAIRLREGWDGIDDRTRAHTGYFESGPTLAAMFVSSEVGVEYRAVVAGDYTRTSLRPGWFKPVGLVFR